MINILKVYLEETKISLPVIHYEQSAGADLGIVVADRNL